jgi:hypothetical protein
MNTILYIAVTIYLLVKAWKAGWWKKALAIVGGAFFAQFLVGFHFAALLYDPDPDVALGAKIIMAALCWGIIIGQWVWLNRLSNNPKTIPKIQAEIIGALKQADVIELTDKIN